MTLRQVEWAVLALAVAIRVAGLASMADSPWAERPRVDAYTYWDQARQLLAGKDPFAEAGAYYQPPGYPHFLAAVVRLGGGEADLGWVRQCQALLGVSTTWGVLVLGRRLGARLALPWLGAIAALLYTLYPTVLLFEQDILTPALTGALLTGALVLVWRQRSVRGWRGGLAGLLLGVCAAVHPTYLLAVPALVGVLAVGRQPRTALALVLGLALGLAPTTWRNWHEWDQVALVSQNAGLNLYLANNPDWKDTGFLKAGLPFRQLVLEAEPHRRDQFERNAYWLQRTSDEVRADPATWLGGVATRMVWSVSRLEIPRNEDYRCRTATGPLSWVGWLPVRYAWVFPLALFGAWRSWRAGDRLLVLTWLLLHVQLWIFLVADRYRVSTWPLVSLAAAAGAATLWEAVRSRTFEVRWLALLVPAALLPWVPIDPRAAHQVSWCLHVEGHHAWLDEDIPKAAARYEAALYADPEATNSRYGLAQSLHRLDRHDAAADALGPVLADFPDSYKALTLMSRIQEDRRDIAAAARYSGRAYRVPGPRTRTGVRWIRLLLEAGEREQAERVARGDPALAAQPKVQQMLGW